MHSQENTSFLMSLLETHNHNPMLACPVCNVAFLLNSSHSTYLIYIPPHVQVVQVGRCNTFEFDTLDMTILINLRVVCQASQNITLDFRCPLAPNKGEHSPFHIYFSVRCSKVPPFYSASWLWGRVEGQ